MWCSRRAGCFCQDDSGVSAGVDEWLRLPQRRRQWGWLVPVRWRPAAFPNSPPLPDHTCDAAEGRSLSSGEVRTMMESSGCAVQVLAVVAFPAFAGGAGGGQDGVGSTMVPCVTRRDGREHRQEGGGSPHSAMMSAWDGRKQMRQGFWCGQLPYAQEMVRDFGCVPDDPVENSVRERPC